MNKQERKDAIDRMKEEAQSQSALNLAEILESLNQLISHVSEKPASTTPEAPATIEPVVAPKRIGRPPKVK